MFKRWNLLLCAAMLAANSFRADAQAGLVMPFEPPNARAAALGGFHSALTDDFSSAFYNPAGFASISPVKSYLESNFELKSSDTIYSLYNDKFSGEALLNLIKDKIETGIVLSGPISFGAIKNGFGWRVFNATRMDISWDNNNVFVVYPVMSEEFAVSFGYGVRIYEIDNATLDAGVLIKGFYRVVYNPEGVFVQELRHFFAEVDENPYAAEIGLAFDGGIRWTKNNSFSIAFSFQNAALPVYTMYYKDLYEFARANIYKTDFSEMKPRLSAGISYRLKSMIMHRWNTDFIFCLDYAGIYELFNIYDADVLNSLLFIRAGIEIRILEVLSLRGCWSEWSPGGGIGIDFTYFILDFALFGHRSGIDINSRQSWVATLGIHFQSQQRK